MSRQDADVLSLSYLTGCNVFQRRDGVYDFFPVGRAMALSTKDKDVVLEMLEDLKSKVNFIEEKMLRDVS